ncbi:MAG: GNAT family N-acetyltransferase [Anaerolineales bacterium]|nr:GNAT family N-acetyltransferase [Anaerolineales bacterium]
MNEIKIINLLPEHAEALAQLQIDCFATMHPSERISAAQFRHHYKLFPEGNFVALDGDRVVGLGSGFFINFDFDDADHTFSDIIDNGWYNNHDPNGAYYYGADISVHPSMRGRGIGRLLYETRKAVVKAYNKKGIVAGGLLPGFAKHKGIMTVQTYVEKVIAGELYDGTLSFQLHNGFVVRKLLQNYVIDTASDNWATLIEWVNPDYQPS